MILIPGILLTGLCLTIDLRLASVGLGLLVLSLVFLWLAGSRDPGYIPRQLLPFAKGPLNALAVSYVLQSAPLKRNPLELGQVTIPYQTTLLGLKYCSTCNS